MQEEVNDRGQEAAPLASTGQGLAPVTESGQIGHREPRCHFLSTAVPLDSVTEYNRPL